MGWFSPRSVFRKTKKAAKKVVKGVDKAIVEPLEKPVKKVVKGVDKAIVEPLEKTIKKVDNFAEKKIERPIKKIVKKVAIEVEDTVTGKNKYTRSGDKGGGRTAASKAAPRQQTEEPEAYLEKDSLKIKKKRKGKRQLRVEPQDGLKINSQGGLNVPKG